MGISTLSSLLLRFQKYNQQIGTTFHQTETFLKAFDQKICTCTPKIADTKVQTESIRVKTKAHSKPPPLRWVVVLFSGSLSSAFTCYHGTGLAGETGSIHHCPRILPPLQLLSSASNTPRYPPRGAIPRSHMETKDLCHMPSVRMREPLYFYHQAVISINAPGRRMS